MRSAAVLLVPLAMLAGVAASSFAQGSLVEQGRAAIARGAPDSAITILERAVAESPQDAEAHYQLAVAHGGKAMASGLLGKLSHVKKARRELETAIALDPRHIEARMMSLQADLAAPGIMGGSVDKALEQARAIKDIDPVVGHRAFAYIYTDQKKPALAKQELLDAVREHPESPKARSYLGQYRSNVEKDYAGAFAEFEAALRIDPGYMAAYYHLGRTAALADSNLDRGEQSLKKYLDYTPKRNEPTLAWAHYQLGNLYEAAGRKAEAEQSFKAALALDPSLKEASQALKRARK